MNVGSTTFARRFRLCLACFLAPLLNSGITATAQAAWSVAQLTSTSYDESAPRISGANAVWSGNQEIYLYDGSATLQLTSNAYPDYAPDVFGDRVVWIGRPFAETVYLYDGATTPLFSTTSLDETPNSPRVSASHVVWQQGVGGDTSIHCYNGSTIAELATSAIFETTPQLDGARVAWYGGADIFYYDGSSVVQLTDDVDYDEKPQISGDHVVWQTHEGATTEYDIFMYDGSSIVRLTDNSIDDVDPQIDGTSVVWSQRSYTAPYDFEIAYYDGTSTHILTHNDYADVSPQISGSLVVWEGDVGGDSEIFVYDALTDSITQLTDNDYDDVAPQISGETIAWRGWDGHDYEIFYATIGTVAHTWSSTLATDSWSNSAAWSPAGVPEFDWHARVVRSMLAPATQISVVDAAFTVDQVTVAGNGGQMRLVVPNAEKLEVRHDMSIEAGGVVSVEGTAVATAESFSVQGGGVLAMAGGTVATTAGGITIQSAGTLTGYGVTKLVPETPGDV
ncbi:MAG: hypothetical protein KDA61_10940, partial [Planctomycetales bacterium]|nr:hypothetical protein [Planctomycetales bacterium]